MLKEQLFQVLLLLTVPMEMSQKINNVCRNIFDYMTIDSNEKCWYDPDVGSLTKDVIIRHGYPFRSYDVITQDGYKNVLYRVPYNSSHTQINRQPILLVSGFGGGPINFLYLGNQSLAFYLVNNGYDVWFINRRGSFNKGHVTYPKDSEQFWNFSFHETGIYDIKAGVSFIGKHNKQKIIILCYSIGCAELFAYASTCKSQIRRRIAGYVAVAPVVTVTNAYTISHLFLKFVKLIEGFLRFNNLHYLPAQYEPDLSPTIFSEIFPMYFWLSFVEGKNPNILAVEHLPSLMKSEDTPRSLKTLIHIQQLYSSGGRFLLYDYGPTTNLKIYKSKFPPPYGLSNIKVPVYLFYGKNDVTSPKEDVSILFNELKSVKNKSILAFDEFNHFAFTLARNIEELFHQRLLKILKENLSSL